MTNHTWKNILTFWAKNCKNLKYIGKLLNIEQKLSISFLKLTNVNSFLERGAIWFIWEQWNTYLAMESNKYHINGKSMEENQTCLYLLGMEISTTNTAFKAKCLLCVKSKHCQFFWHIGFHKLVIIYTSFSKLKNNFRTPTLQITFKWLSSWYL